MSALDKNFMGLDSFIWWFGIPENRQDPLGLGRVQVRIYGWHTDSLVDLPTENLPWASMVHAVNNRSFDTPREDDLVFGFFSDGRNAQFPVIIGIVPGYFTQKPNIGLGFNDLRSLETLRYAPKHPIGRTYNTDGSGIILLEANTADANVLNSFRHPNADEIDKNSITGISRYQNLANTVIQARKSNLDKNIITANNIRWSEPYPAYNPLYPYNKANETESGHVFELDDTPGSERIHLAHRSGSYVEWFPTGTKVEKITKSNYQVVMADDHLHVMGRVMITVDSDALIRVKGDVILESGGKLTANVANDVNFSVGGNFNVKANNVNFDIQNDITGVSKTSHLTTSESVDISTKNLNLTSSGDTNINSGGKGNFQTSSDMNLDSGGAANYTSAGKMSAGLIAMDGSISFTATVNNQVIDPQGGVGTIQPTGSVSSASGASTAASGKATGLPNAIQSLTKNTGEALPEDVPIPIPGPFFPNYDPETGTAFKHSLLLINSANNTLVPPDSNTSNIPTGNCTFDPSTKTFISDSNSWSISQNGIAIIQDFEKFAKVVSTNTVTPYPDPVTGGEPLTVGYGTTSVAINQPITLGELISRSTAESYLETSINNTYLPALQQYINVPLTQNMIDACLSFIYNCGEGNFAKSTLRRKINSQQWCAAGNAFLAWNKSGGNVVSGLTKRRSRERALFLT